MYFRIAWIVVCCIMIIFLAGCAQTGTSPPLSTQSTDTPQEKIAQERQTEQQDPTQERIPALGDLDETINERIDIIIQGMTLEQKVGQLIITDYPSAIVGADAAWLMDHVHPGGIVFGTVNFQNALQTRKLAADLNSLSDIPLIISCTEEGGRVSCTTGNDMATTLLPDLWTIGQIGDPDLAYRAGKVLGAELVSLGINLDFAPVADIWNNPENTVIGDRSFGDDPELVAQMVAQMVRGMREQGLGTVLKHFPGHGGTTQDSHTEMTYSDSTLEQLQKNEFVPFTAGIEAGSDGIMTAHIVLPSVMENEMPSTVSYTVLTEILRDQLGFSGLIITDSMHMQGMTEYAQVPAACVMAVKAGADIVLTAQEYVYEVFDALLTAAKSGEITEQRLDRSVRRILLFKFEHKLYDEQYELPDPQLVLGASLHLKLVEEIIDRAEQ